MSDKKEKLKAWAQRNRSAAAGAAVVGLLATMTDEQRVAALRANGHDAHLLRDRRIVLRLHGRVYRVVGGDFVRPSLMQLEVPIEMFDTLGQKGSSRS